MKKFAILTLALATLSANAGFAQSTTNSTGKGAVAGKNGTSNAFAWGIGLGALAVVGTVVGLVAASASGSPSTFSH